MRYKDEIITIQIQSCSLIGVSKKDYPLDYGNYCTIEYDGKELHLINMCCENLKEIMKMLGTDKLKVRIFYEENISTIAIIDDRIPQDWYLFWINGYDSGCSPDVGVKIWETLGERFTNQKEKPLTQEHLRENFIKQGGTIGISEDGLEIWNMKVDCSSQKFDSDWKVCGVKS